LTSLCDTEHRPFGFDLDLLASLQTSFLVVGGIEIGHSEDRLGRDRVESEFHGLLEGHPPGPDGFLLAVDDDRELVVMRLATVKMLILSEVDVLLIARDWLVFFGTDHFAEQFQVRLDVPQLVEGFAVSWVGRVALYGEIAKFGKRVLRPGGPGTPRLGYPHC
jgi:hypothetical protein